MRLCAFALALFFASYSYGRSPASIRKDAFTVGVIRSDSAAEYDFISEISAKMKFSRFRLVVFENANAGQKQLLDGKIDAIISKINYLPHLESKFLVSDYYSKTEIAAATNNSEIWSLADLNEKKLAYIPKDISSQQIQNIWQNSKPIAAQNLSSAISLLQKQEVMAIIASKQSLEIQNDSALRIFPNKLQENNIVALFAPNSKQLKEEFNKALELKINSTQNNIQNNSSNKTLNNIDKIMFLLSELKNEIEILKKELK